MGGMKDLLGDTPYAERKPEQMTRRGDPATSFEAAARVARSLNPLQEKVLAAIRNAGSIGMTDLDLQEALGDHGSTFRTRRAELVEAKLVVDSGATRKQLGSNRIVWLAAEFANGR